MGSGGLAARRDLERAERALSRRAQERLRFGSVSGALAWYARSRPAASAAKSARPRTWTLPNQQVVLVPVDGGAPGGTHEDVLALLLTVGDLLERLRRERPAYVEALEYLHGIRELPGWTPNPQGVTQAEVAKALGISQSTVSRWSGWCEDRMAAVLQSEGIL